MLLNKLTFAMNFNDHLLHIWTKSIGLALLIMLEIYVDLDVCPLMEFELCSSKSFLLTDHVA
jgi:hypothetical protein